MDHYILHHFFSCSFPGKLLWKVQPLNLSMYFQWNKLSRISTSCGWHNKQSLRQGKEGSLSPMPIFPFPGSTSVFRRPPSAQCWLWLIPRGVIHHLDDPLGSYQGWYSTWWRWKMAGNAPPNAALPQVVLFHFLSPLAPMGGKPVAPTSWGGRSEVGVQA